MLQDTIVSEVMTITPELARTLLSDSERPRNRSISPDTVDNYARTIRQGRWQMTGEAIKLTAPMDQGGKLVDGQHRLAAVDLSNTPIESLVVYGINEDAYVSMDRGRRRNAAHYLQIHGYSDTNNLAAAAAQMIVWNESQTFQQKRVERYPTPDEVLEVVRANPGLAQYVKRAHHVRSGHWGLPVSTIAVLYDLFAAQSQEDADTFFGKLRTGVDLTENDPIRKLREKLLASSTIRRRIPRDEFAALFIKAWNAFRSGETVSNLSFRAGGTRPERMPDII